MVLAQEEARLLGHSFIGTEHMLLGLIHEGEGVASVALRNLDVTLEAVRKKVEEIVGKEETAPSGSPPFTPRCKKVLELALREALQLGHSYIGTEHILLGLVREGEGVGAGILVGLGADLAKVRQTVIQAMSGQSPETGTRSIGADEMEKVLGLGGAQANDVNRMTGTQLRARIKELEDRNWRLTRIIRMMAEGL